MSEKIIGYILIFTGLGLIIGAGVNIYQIVTRQTRPVQIFSFSGISINTDQLLVQEESIRLENVTSEQQEIINELLKEKNMNASQEGQNNEGAMVEILPGDVLTETSNLFAHIFLMGFLASIGSRISSIGVLMVRPIVVKLKQKETKEDDGWLDRKS